MRLSTIFELLLIFLLIAFAAYARVIDKNEVSLHRLARATKPRNTNFGLPTLKQATEVLNRSCTCDEHSSICSCCKDFHIPYLAPLLKGPGCATLQYIAEDKLAIQLSIADDILTSNVVNGKAGKNPKPVCVTLAGGVSKFCGKVYSIKRESDKHFKACLGLELRSKDDLEASLRVGCFRFGPDGLKIRPAEPVPYFSTAAPATTDDDDDDDIFGLGSDDEDDDEDDDDVNPEGNAVPDSSADEDDDDDDDDDDDPLGFGALLDIFTGGSDSGNKKPKTTTTQAPVTVPHIIPILTTPKSNGIPIVTHQPVATAAPHSSLNEIADDDQDLKLDVTTSSTVDDAAESGEEEETTTTAPKIPEDDNVAIESEPVAYVSKPEKGVTKHKKPIVASNNKPSLTSQSINAIKNEIKKPVKPVKPQSAEEEDDDDDDILEDLEEDEDDDEKEENHEETEGEDEEEEDENKGEEHKDQEAAEEDEKDTDNEEEDVLDDDDDDEEEEDEVLTSLVEDDKEKPKQEKVKNDKFTNNKAENLEEDDNDYGYDLEEILARKSHGRSARGRQSKVMRF